MIGMVININGDNAWPDLQGRSVIFLDGNQTTIKVAVLSGGLKSGRPSVAIRLDLPDGQHVVAETTARLFVSAAQAILAKYPDLFEDKPDVRN